MPSMAPDSVPTLPTARPFETRPWASSEWPTAPDGGTERSSVIALLALVRFGVGNHYRRDGDDPQHLRRGRTQEQAARGGQPAGSDDQEVAVMPVQLVDRGLRRRPV